MDELECGLRKLVFDFVRVVTMQFDYEPGATVIVRFVSSHVCMIGMGSDACFPWVGNPFAGGNCSALFVASASV